MRRTRISRFQRVTRRSGVTASETTSRRSAQSPLSRIVSVNGLIENQPMCHSKAIHRAGASVARKTASLSAEDVRRGRSRGAKRQRKVRHGPILYRTHVFAIHACTRPITSAAPERPCPAQVRRPSTAVRNTAKNASGAMILIPPCSPIESRSLLRETVQSARAVIAHAKIMSLFGSRTTRTCTGSLTTVLNRLRSSRRRR